MKTILVFLTLLLGVSPTFADSPDNTPKLNLLVHKTVSSAQMSGWIFEVRNFDDQPVHVSDLEIRFWVYEPNRQLVGLRFKEGEWKNLKGVVNGEAVMCAFLSPPFETVASRKADYAIRYRSAAETMILPGGSWKDIRIGYAAPNGGVNEQCDYSQIPLSQKKLGEPWWFNGMYDDPHFCLYYRGTLVREWENAKNLDPNTGVEPDPYKTGRDKIVRQPVRQQIEQASINPAYARMPELTQPIRFGDDTRYIAVGGDMINVGKAKQEIQKYAQDHPGQNQFARVLTGNPNIHQANLPSSPNAPTGGGSFTYDANGNTLTDPSGKTYEYDALNQLIHVTGTGLDISYIYDGDGLRVSKINNLTGVRTNFLWDRNNLTGIPQVVEELQNGQVIRTYVYGPRQYGIVYQHQLVNGAWQTNYYGKDGQGNVRFLMDESGNVTDRYDYDAFGIILNRTGSTPNNMLYAGEYFDDDTGLVYLRSRWYAPDIGRFYTMDSDEGDREDPLSLHKYVYAQNDPVNRNDPTGFDSNTVGSAESRLLSGLLLFGQPLDDKIRVMKDPNPSTFGLTVHTMLVFYNWKNKNLVDSVLEAGPERHQGQVRLPGLQQYEYGYLKRQPLPHNQPIPPTASLFEVLNNPYGSSEQNDKDFKNDIVKVFNKYNDDVLYFPVPQFIFPHTANSNSFTGSIIRGMGLNDSGPWNAVGWNTEVISGRP